MGPKLNVKCYVCFKEFGSRSIPFQEPKCLKKWLIAKKNLTAEIFVSTPVKPASWKYNRISIWISSHCQLSVLFAKKNQRVSNCSVKKLSLNNRRTQRGKMTGVVKAEFSPKRGKENKNISNHIPTLSVLKKNAKNEAKAKTKDFNSNVAAQDDSDIKNKELASQLKRVSEIVISDDTSNSTSKRSVRPQTKILRRPTPNLKHPVIQVDSDDSSGDSSCSDKGKEDNPKRLKMGESTDPSQKPKNFIMYNKYNVEKNTKNTSKERTSVTITSLIPNPCNSCNRSQQPERLHSHARKDARGLMNRKSPSLDNTMTSPQKKAPENLEKPKFKRKDTKTPVSPNCDTNKNVSDTKEHTLEMKDNLQKVPSESCVVEAVKESQENDKNILEIVKPCYICQEEVKISSLLLHESQCLESWKKTNNSLTPNLRKLPPRRPDEDEIPSPDEDDPSWTAVQSQLIPCAVCGRTFFPERLPVHRRVCKGKPSPRPLKRASSMRETSASSRQGEEQRPTAVYVPCYICGRNYGSWVISMHEQKCLRKWRKENEKLPDDQQEEEPQNMRGSSPDDIEASFSEFGDSAWESHLQQLVPCPLCSRTFFPNRLAVHKRSCKGVTSGTRPRSNKAS